MISVFLNIEGEKHFVGRLLRQDSGNFFQYTPEFISTGLQISPFYLPLNNTVFKAPATPFNALHGVFADSIPDGWGLLLILLCQITRSIFSKIVIPAGILSELYRVTSGYPA